MSEYITLLPFIAPISCFHLDRYLSICMPENNNSGFDGTEGATFYFMLPIAKKEQQEQRQNYHQGS
jgi:hypothetical protein